MFSLLITTIYGVEFYVATDGNDGNPGTKDKPFATINRARDSVRKQEVKNSITVYLREGTYWLEEAVIFGPEDSGSKDSPIVYRNYENEKVIISGGVKLEGLNWKPYKDGIYKSKVAGGKWMENKEDFDQLFINGQRQHIARYPNFDAAILPFGGYSKDCISKERVATWKNPKGGFVHSMHNWSWGGLHYSIKGVKANGELDLEGPVGNNRLLGIYGKNHNLAEIHSEKRFVENVFEELDAPGEWFLDRKENVLYAYPLGDIDLSNAVLELAGLRHVIEFKGSSDAPVRHIQLQGFTVTHAGRTFMETDVPLLRSDWEIYYGGAVLIEGCEDILLKDLFVDTVGGNGIFVSRYNRRVNIEGCKVADAGASSVCFVGDVSAVRSPCTQYLDINTWENLDLEPGPKSPDYPADCRVHDCLLIRNGHYEKQTCGVQISMAMNITVSHCTIYDSPRSGINVGDGCWGGHMIEWNDVFDTVKETQDHGAFNSWGRDRYWHVAGINYTSNKKKSGGMSLEEFKKKHADLPFLDAMKVTVIRNNRWSSTGGGYDIDLDDGSTNYEIYNNLCLKKGIKLREGFKRICYNNICWMSRLGVHRWYPDSMDVVKHNIFMAPYNESSIGEWWGKEMDYNFFHWPEQPEGPALELSYGHARDKHSIQGNAQFVDIEKLDFRVKESSPALKLGFKNFPMTGFGVLKAAFKDEALKPEMEEYIPYVPSVTQEVEWYGATLKNLVTIDEASSVGFLYSEDPAGILFKACPEDSPAYKIGFRKLDVLLNIDGRDLSRGIKGHRRLLFDEKGKIKKTEHQVIVWREQQEHKMVIKKDEGGK